MNFLLCTITCSSHPFFPYKAIQISHISMGFRFFTKINHFPTTSYQTQKLFSENLFWIYRQLMVFHLVSIHKYILQIDACVE